MMMDDRTCSTVPNVPDSQIRTIVKSIFGSPAGRVLQEWLAWECNMRTYTADPAADTAITLARREALRELYIKLDMLIREDNHESNG
jgi:hypothetical protein